MKEILETIILNMVDNKEAVVITETLEEKKVNYVVDLDNTIIIIKAVPAKVCTQCGEQYFDDETAENIEKIVNQLKQLATEVTIVNYKEKVA